MESITLLSPAKINLVLRVLGKLPDGYHEISCVNQIVNLFDRVRIDFEEVGGEVDRGIEVEAKGLDGVAPKDNLAWKAANGFLAKSELNLEVKIHIDKSIPLGAGLGGGSGNAASVLFGLNKATQRFTDDELISLALDVGSDVPFFIHSRTALVEGRGEKITLIHGFPTLHYVLINPGIAADTKKVYGRWDETAMEPREYKDMETTIDLFKQGGLPVGNDLETAATDLHPAIIAMKGLLESMGTNAVSMTGSGSTVFAVFTETKEADAVYDYLKDSSTFKVFRAESIEGWHRL